MTGFFPAQDTKTGSRRPRGCRSSLGIASISRFRVEKGGFRTNLDGVPGTCGDAREAELGYSSLPAEIVLLCGP